MTTPPPNAASGTADTHRLRRRVHIAASIACLVVVMLGLGAAQTLRARSARLNAQDTLVDTYLRTIGVSRETYTPSNEREALWDLAELAAGEVRVREQLIDRWLQTPDLAGRALRYDGAGLQAAVGRNAGLRNRVARRIGEVAEGFAHALEVPRETDEERLEDPSSALVAAAPWMEPKDAARVVQRLAEALEKPGTGDDFRPGRLSHALAALAVRMEPEAAAHVAGRLAQALENPRETDPPRLVGLSRALAALAARVEPQDAASAVALQAALGLDKALENSRSGHCRAEFLGRQLVALSARMQPRDVARLADRLAGDLTDPRNTDVYRRSNQAAALAVYSTRIGPQDAVRLVEQLDSALANPQETDADRLSDLGLALAALLARIEPGQASRSAAGAVQRLTQALENPQENDPYQLANLTQMAINLAGLVGPEDTARVAERGGERLLKALENPQEPGVSRVVVLARALALSGTRMEPHRAANMAERLARNMEHPRASSADRLAALGRALAALSRRMESTDAARVTARGGQVVASALERRQITSAQRLHLAFTLAALSSRMESPDASRVAARGVQRLTDAFDNPPEEFANHVAAALAVRMEPVDVARVAERLAQALEEPRDIDAHRLGRLGSGLAAAAARMPGDEGPRVAVRGACVLARSRANPQPTTASGRARLGSGLLALADVIPAARQTRLLAMSHTWLEKVDEQEPEERKLLVRCCKSLTPQDLAEMLKWPFCVGEAERIVLAELERQLTEKLQRPILLGGDVWKFVAQAESLGIKDIDAPAKRPSAQDVLAELEALRETITHSKP